jgi:cyclopropane-fatty-acyl-phospholipid synthase
MHEIDEAALPGYPTAWIESAASESKRKSAPQRGVQALLAGADIAINGRRPWDIRVHDERFYRMALSGSLGFGEAYMAGYWDSDCLDELVYKIFRSKILDSSNVLRDGMLFIRSQLGNLGAKHRSFKAAKRHYDLGNDLFICMLDFSLSYTCGYWKNAQTLEEAQEAKLDLICRKLGLTPGKTVLDIGCGWGSFGKFAAERYGVRVVGITLSSEQVKLGRELCAGLPVEFRLEDYRDTKGAFDFVVSMGMFEHVGYKNYQTYMRVAHERLKNGGLFLLHTIGGNSSMTNGDPWSDRYIFPNAMVPSIRQVGSAIEKLFVVEDWHNFGPDYDKTLLAWFRNFDAHWHELRGKYDDTFYRMWKFYLLSFAGIFRSRYNHLWQIVLSKDGVPGGYSSIR